LSGKFLEIHCINQFWFGSGGKFHPPTTLYHSV
jgi:hypothetical protein